MKRGDHIYIYHVEGVTGMKYTHHGIYCSDDEVIHYYKGKIRRTHLAKFGREYKIYVKKYKKCDSTSVVIKRAKSRKCERLYNLIFNNCEHFAYWCKTGKHKSKQVDDAPKKLLQELEKKLKKAVKLKPPKRVKVKLPKIRVKVPFA